MDLLHLLLAVLAVLGILSGRYLNRLMEKEHQKSGNLELQTLVDFMGWRLSKNDRGLLGSYKEWIEWTSRRALESKGSRLWREATEWRMEWANLWHWTQEKRREIQGNLNRNDGN